MPQPLLPLPPEAVARATDQASIQAPFLNRGSGPAVVVGSALGPLCGAGDEVDAQCGMRVFRRTVGRGPVVPEDAAEGLCVAGHRFASLSGTGCRVWGQSTKAAHDLKGQR